MSLSRERESTKLNNIHRVPALTNYEPLVGEHLSVESSGPVDSVDSRQIGRVRTHTTTWPGIEVLPQVCLILETLRVNLEKPRIKPYSLVYHKGQVGQCPYLRIIL
jgi:hypothetical protein